MGSTGTIIMLVLLVLMFIAYPILISKKNKREQEVFNKIREAAKAVMIEQKLDTIIDKRGVFVGGLDITDMVISKLKSVK